MLGDPCRGRLRGVARRVPDLLGAGLRPRTWKVGMETRAPGALLGAGEEDV